MSLHINNFWLEGLSDPDREKMKNLVLGNTILLDKMTKMLYNMEEGKQSITLADYDSASWSHKQAHLNGERAVLRKIIDMIKIVEREDPPAV